MQLPLIRRALDTRREAFSRRWRTCPCRSVAGRSRQALPGRREVWEMVQRYDRRCGPAEGDAGRGRRRPGERCRDGDKWRPPESVSVGPAEVFRLPQASFGCPMRWARRSKSCVPRSVILSFRERVVIVIAASVWIGWRMKSFKARWSAYSRS